MTSRRRLIGALALFCLAMALVPGAALAAGSSISGTVTDAETREPVAGVEVCAWPVDPEAEGTAEQCGDTQADGTYVVELEPGDYKVKFWPGGSGQNLALQFYDGKDRWDEADVVAVEPGMRTSGIDAELDPGATISGTVFSAAHGQGLEGIRVCSIDAPSSTLWICGWTDEDGHYALPFHSQGEYKVVFSLSLEEWFGEEVVEDDGFAPQFWNNRTRLAAADVIPLSTGQTVAGIDARLRKPAFPPAIAAFAASAVSPAPYHRRKRCNKGYVKKKINGKVRCVRRHRHHHRHHGVALFASPQSSLFGSLLAGGIRFPVVR